MYQVFYNKKINENSYEMKVKAPLCVKKALPGQFVIIMAYSDSERIPLTIYDYDREEGSITLIYQVVGASTLELTTVKDSLYGIVGPLGNANEICKNPDNYRDKRIVYVAGGVGVAPVYPQVKYLKSCGIEVDVIYGARSASLYLIRDKLEKEARKVFYATDDGSFGTKGFVTDILEEKRENYDLCVTIGPVIMMKNVCEVCKKYGIASIVSMNPLMVDGSGMCGACRCEVDAKPKFACIHGPEFDGSKVNFDLALKRMNVYKNEEAVKMEEMKEKLAKRGVSYE